jgi:adenylyl- and sulfurtransferase ThiI
LEQLSEIVLKPVFGDDKVAKKVRTFQTQQFLQFSSPNSAKFAIRPSIRNNELLNRDFVIKTVAQLVDQMSPSHSVDLTNYDCLILVEVYRVSSFRCQEK